MLVSKRREDDGSVNLLPIMNLVSILIPFMLMTTNFVQLAVIDTTVPALAAKGERAEDEPAEPLTLTLYVTSQGIGVGGADAIVYGASPPDGEGANRPPTLPCPGGVCSMADSYDWRGLTGLLSRIKDANPDETDVLIVPERRIPYEVIVRAMDASREDPDARGPDGRARALFPKVVLAQGAL